jgi:hypothetical protein
MSEATAVRKPRQRRKQQRFCKVVRGENGVRTLTLRVGKQTDAYDLHEIKADYGRGFELTKADGTVYHANLDGRASACDCKGHCKHGHCKHVDSLTALEAAGKL